MNDAYLGAWNTIPPAKPDPLQAYICKIIRNISLKLYYRKTAAKRSSVYETAMQEIEDYLSAPNTVEAEMETRELAGIIENFLEALTTENRVIADTKKPEEEILHGLNTYRACYVPAVSGEYITNMPTRDGRFSY